MSQIVGGRPAGAGRGSWAWGDLLTLEVAGAEGRRSYEAMACEVGPGSSTPLHTHRAEDELLYVVEGEMRVLAPGREALVGPGGFALIPRGTAHALANEGAAAARCLLALTPDSLERLIAGGAGVGHAQGPRPAAAPEGRATGYTVGAANEL